MGNVVRLDRRQPRRPGAAAPGRAAPAVTPLWREALGRQLRGEREFRGERIADVAGRAGLSPQYLSELERGKKDPSSEMLEALAGALDLAVVDLTRRTSTQLMAVAPAQRGSGQVLLAA
ncbi:helix-turn-helix domain-containing protein [Ornithinimicrobium faecis]|uniref:Helix-turn-helix domain-containing protein n=1 Tax=Ornithinimicrobium faecis TaxID=2934158 RepID=A0ABY4YYB9_9MICO|nr:helix-turn-helix transcriptional regulator [Ornithinimicrobium sp. HY1793]USQ81776.1 helix-turn-helix domain-containing protein [Ornithinimicrobium sp. HY1793]